MIAPSEQVRPPSEHPAKPPEHVGTVGTSEQRSQPGSCLLYKLERGSTIDRLTSGGTMGGAITYQEDTTMQAVIYLRTGNQGQTLDMAIDMQRDSTHNLIAQRGWTIAGEYVDAGVPARPDVPRPGAAH